MKHFFYLFLTLVSSQYAYANMGEPYIHGSSHNALYSSSYCDVIGGKIKIVIHEKQDVDHKLFGVFQIRYNIHAESDQKIPLLFIGKGLSDAKKIIVKQSRVVPRLLDSQSVKQYAFITRAPEGSYYYALLIDFFLQKQSKHGYVLLLVIYYPFVVLTYGIALGVFKMTIIDKYKAK